MCLCVWIPRCINRPASSQGPGGKRATAEVSEPAPWATGREGNRLHRAKCCVVFFCSDHRSWLYRQHEHQSKTQTANAAGKLLPLDCIDRGGLSLQRKVHLGCNFPAYFYLQQRAGNPKRRDYSFQTRSSLGFLSTVKSRARTSGSLWGPAFCRLRQERHMGSAECRLWVLPAPSYLIVRAAGNTFVFGNHR